MPRENSKQRIRQRNDHKYVHLTKGCDFYEAGDLLAAESEFLQAARLGSPEAQVNLGNLYSSNELGPPNIKKAIHYYKKAIINGSAEGALNIALTYKELGKNRFYLFWMKRAAILGEADAIKAISGE